jgi:hypothetical protein
METIDIAAMLEQADDATKGMFMAGKTEFLQISFVTSPKSKLWVVSDSDGYLTSITKTYPKIKNRIATNDRIKQILTISGRLAIMQPDSIAFSTIVDGRLSPGYCENGMKSLTSGEEFAHFVVETFRTK